MRRVLATLVIMVCVGQPLAAQTLRFPRDAIVLEEVYQGCTLIHQRQMLGVEYHHDLARALIAFNRRNNKTEGTALRKFLMEHFPEFVYIKIQIGECGTPS